MGQRRPDVQFVGDDRVSLNKVKDFAPYVANIRAAGADSLLTGNWGADLSLLLKASYESGLTAQYYAVLGAGFWTPSALGATGTERMKTVYSWIKVGSLEPVKAAHALEGMHFAAPTGDFWMRADDHPFVGPVLVMNFAKAGGAGVRHDVESTGYGWKTEARIGVREAAPPCAVTWNAPAPEPRGAPARFLLASVQQLACCALGE